MSARNEASADGELLITRTLDAPVPLVFRIWARQEHMIRWLGPKDFTCTHLEMDFRPGGRWHGRIRSDTHGESRMGGEYRVIERDRRIVFTFAWQGDDGEPDTDTVITVTFDDENGRTVQRFHQQPFVNAETRNSHAEGWNECFDRELAYAERLAGQATP